MPYSSPDSVPSYVPKEHRESWMKQWNAVYKSAVDSGNDQERAEELAFGVANKAIKTEAYEAALNPEGTPPMNVNPDEDMTRQTLETTNPQPPATVPKPTDSDPAAAAPTDAITIMASTPKISEADAVYLELKGAKKNADCSVV